MTHLLKRLRSEQRGVATVEFALWTVTLFIVILAGLDVGAYASARSKLGQAVEAASLSAFMNRENVSWSNLETIIRQGAELPANSGLQVTNACNGTANSCVNASRSCACLSRTGTYVAANSCTADCGAGATSGTKAGYYLTITATHPYSTALIPAKWIGKNVRQSVTLRLQ